MYKIGTKLTKHFSYGEMIRSDTAIRYGIENIPNEEEVENLKSLCAYVLEPIRYFYNSPVFVSSGYRSLEVNTKCNGSLTSQHMKGQAADFIVAGQPNLVIWKWIILESGIYWDQIIAEFFSNGGWIHISYKKEGDNRNKITTAVKENRKTVYRHYTIEDVFGGNYII